MEKSDTTVSVFCCCHKPSLLADFGCVRRIQVGKAASNLDLGMIGDDSGDNISAKNPYFCELTATYWIWRNCHDDIVGLIHYRRFFDLSGKKRLFMSGYGKIASLRLDRERVLEIMRGADCIAPALNFYFFRAKDHYARGWYARDMELALDAIRTHYPDVYPTALKCMRSRTGHCFNMLIARKDFFDEYASFLFTVMDEVEESIQGELDSRNPYQRRAYGFLAEHLTSIFLTWKREACSARVMNWPVSLILESKWEWVRFAGREIRFFLQELFFIKRG